MVVTNARAIHGLLLVLALLAIEPGRLAAALIISEINYHPPAGDEALEFIEVANDSTTPEDISGYAFVEGISFVFPAGTVLGARGVLVVCADVVALKARYGIENAVGNYQGRLDAGGERLTVVDVGGILVHGLAYNDRGKWPTAPDGTGHTLVLRRPSLDGTEPESWMQSPELGGSPGSLSTTLGSSNTEDRILLDQGAPWRYRRGVEPFSTPVEAWRGVDFDDTAWTPGAAPFGYGYDAANTVLGDMRNRYTAVALRQVVWLTDDDVTGPSELYLLVDYDDGFCAHVNGEEVVRANAGDYGVEPLSTSIATQSRSAGMEEVFKIPARFLRSGRNVLALVGFNQNIANADFLLGARLLRRRPLQVPRPPLPAVTFNELVRGSSPGVGWVELHNDSGRRVDLSGYQVTDDPDQLTAYKFSPGTTMVAGGFLVLEEAVVQAQASQFLLSRPEVSLFLVAPDGVVVTAASFGRGPPPGVAVGEFAEVRFPDGRALEWVTATPTPGAMNKVAAETNLVINEIYYHPPEERSGEFIELFNRGSAPVDVSGFRFTRGIDYSFPAGTVVAPSAYLVVAEDPSLLATHHGFHQALGPYLGRLANDGENVRLVDRFDNIVDEVRYRDGGAWSEWADGKGASLELIDPEEDNVHGAAWAASDESAKTVWEEHRYEVPEHVPAAESEVHFYLAERGACRIDDVSITRSGGSNHVPNAGFETGTSPWVMQGTHVASRQTSMDNHSGTASLEVVASGRGDTLVNRIEVDTSPALTSGPYDVSLWVRWLRGGSLLVIHGEYTPGQSHPRTAYAENTLLRGLRLTIPWNLGTPGRENTATQARRTLTGSTNVGPIITQVRHTPAAPNNGEFVTVLATVLDVDGVDRVEVFHARQSARGEFVQLQLRDDGNSGDGGAQDGVFAAEFPRVTPGTRLVFYLQATDQRGAVTRFPVQAPERTCLLQVADNVGDGLDAVRIILDNARTAELGNRPLHSNDLLEGTFIFNDEDLFYQVGVRYRGSPWGRPNRNNYRVRFQDDELFSRGRSAINIDPSGGDKFREGSVYFLMRKSAAPDKPAPAGDYEYVRTWFNGDKSTLHSLHQPVDGQLVERWFGTSSGSIALKVEGRRIFDDAPDPMLVSFDGASLAYRGEDRERYRDYFIQSIRQSADEWEPLAALTRVMDPVVTTDAVFDAQIDGVLHVEEFLRVVIPRFVANDTDSFPLGAGHNGYLIFGGADRLWHYVGFDMDHSFGTQNSGLVTSPSADPYVARLLSRPGPRRLYLRLLWEFMRGYGSREVSGAYFEALAVASGISTDAVVTFLRIAETNARRGLVPFTSPVFRITTNLGREITTAGTEVELAGEAPVQIAHLLLDRGNGSIEPIIPEWTSPTTWRASLALPRAENRFEFLGFDSGGSLLGSGVITVFSTSFPGGPGWRSITPSRGPVEGGTPVEILGDGFAPGMKVLFEGVEAVDVRIVNEQVVQAVTPPAAFPLPVDGAVYLELQLSQDSRTRVLKAFEYTLADGFVRGDATHDGALDLADPLAVLFYLFRGSPLLCLDAADTDDNGQVNLTDVMMSLDYLFRAGAAPAAPFPAPGSDATGDGLECPQ